MDDPKFRSQIEVPPVADKGRRREWADAQNERSNAIGSREIANGSSRKAFGDLGNALQQRGVTRFRGRC